MDIFLIICVVGIILNFMILFHELKQSPEGAMGAAPLLLLAFVPYLLVVGFILHMLGVW